VGPNPRVVKMFLAEKGLELDRVEVDLRGGENRRPPYNTDVNPSGQTPALEMANGKALTEITAICEYIEEKHPNPPLVGTTPEERAETRMWTRRLDIQICEPLANGFRWAEGLPLFESRIRCLPEAAAGLKAVAQDGIRFMDEHLKGPWICGDRFTMADIVVFAFLDFGGAVGQPLDPKFKNVGAWFKRVKARPSAAASA
jgi:glutathione S-transferase